MKHRIELEKKVFPKMAEIYCHGNHGTKGRELCPDCQEMCKYALNRLDHCRWGNDKTFCSQCPCHCYRPDMRERVKELMRYSGPRMALYHPILCAAHGCATALAVIKDKIKKAKSKD